MYRLGSSVLVLLLTVSKFILTELEFEFLLTASESLLVVSEFLLKELEASAVVVELSVQAVSESLLLSRQELLLAFEAVGLVLECKKGDWLLLVVAVGVSGTNVT